MKLVNEGFSNKASFEQRALRQLKGSHVDIREVSQTIGTSLKNIKTSGQDHRASANMNKRNKMATQMQGSSYRALQILRFYSKIGRP